MVTASRLRRRLRASRIGRALTGLAERSGLPAAVVLVVVVTGACIAIAGLAFTALLDAGREGDGPAALDLDLHRWIVEHRTGALDDAFRVVTWLGSATVLVPLLLTVVGILWWRRHPVLALGVVLACTGTLLTVPLVKPVIGRARPPLDDRIAGAQGAAFPSGHSANVVAAFGVLAWVATRFVRRRWLRATIWIAAALVALAVGVSRVYLGVHWPSDVLSGWFVGVAWVAAAIGVATLVPALDDRRTRRH
jgi:undecaprenyl-diphosphatase